MRLLLFVVLYTFAILPIAYATPSSVLPTSIQKVLKKSRVDTNDFSLSVKPLNGKGINLKFNERIPRTPASVEKVITSALALEILSPAKVWTTKFVTKEAPLNGVLENDLYLVGQGDPSLTIERFWLLVNKLRSRGIEELNGSLVLDRSLFNTPYHDPFAFDGKGYRTYNLGPDALLLNYRSHTIYFEPNEEKGVAYLYAEPQFQHIEIPKSVPLAKGRCQNWIEQLAPDYSIYNRPIFRGTYPNQCGKKYFIYTAFNPNDYIGNIFRSLWEQSGGKWNGTIKEGVTPQEVETLAFHDSIPLSQLLYGMNKYSNNLIARNVFLTLGIDENNPIGTLELSRKKVSEWRQKLAIPTKELYVDNGSGLSRDSKLSTRATVRILEEMWHSPYVAEYISSLPISGIDGTMKKRKVATGYAHIKTGYIENVRSIAGYIKGASGRYYAVSAIINSAYAIDSMPVMDAVITWIYKHG